MGWKPNHGRIKPRYNPKPTAAESRFKGFVRQQPCFGCGRGPRSQAHHILRDAPGKRWRRDHMFLVPLCPDCHQGPDGIHGIGSEDEWCERNGKDTVAEALRLQDEHSSTVWRNFMEWHKDHV